MKLIKPIIYHDFPCWWYTYPSEKYERQLGLLYYSQLNGKNEIPWFQTTNQFPYIPQRKIAEAPYFSWKSRLARHAWIVTSWVAHLVESQYHGDIMGTYHGTMGYITTAGINSYQ